MPAISAGAAGYFRSRRHGGTAALQRRRVANFRPGHA